MDFKTIEYLKSGTLKQQKAYYVLTKYAIIDNLAPYSPILAGTIPIDIDTADSDLDIICNWVNAELFKNTLLLCFADYKNFKLIETIVREQPTVITTFIIEDFEIEIFGQYIPVLKQHAYQHLVIENNLLAIMGSEFKQSVRELKLQGIKTEPAFAKVLGLKGDPYLELLKYGKEMGIHLPTKSILP